MFGGGVSDYVALGGSRHRHGPREHTHAHTGPHVHDRPEDHPHGEPKAEADAHHHSDDHTHGLVHDSIKRSREGLRAVTISLAVLGITAGAQTLVFALSGSVALLADLIHNYGDALTALPLGIAFLARSVRAEKLAGLAVVGAIFVSACVALYETIQRLVHPEHLHHLWVLAAAGVVG